MNLLLRRGLSSAAEQPPPRPSAGRRVVLTGIGAVTPLGLGVGPTWDLLVAGGCAVRALVAENLLLPGEAAGRTLEHLPSRVAAAVPRGKGEAEFDEEAWTKDNKSISAFVGYALCAAELLELIRPVSGSLNRRGNWKHLRHFGCIIDDR